MSFIRLVATAAAVALLATSAPIGATAAFSQSTNGKKSASSLAGSEGTVKRKILFHSTTEGECQPQYRKYVAASGHSAYAATALDHFYGGFFACAAFLNAPSKAEAERRAVELCKSVITQTKAHNKSAAFLGPCLVHASK